MNSRQTLLGNVDRLHIEQIGVKRVQKNLDLDVPDIMEYLKKKIVSGKGNIYKQGHNYYCSVDGIIITINAQRFTIITANYF